MIKNILGIFENVYTDRYGEEITETIEKRFFTVGNLFNYRQENDYKLIAKEILTSEQLDEQLKKEEGRHKTILNIHKIDNIQILEYKHDAESDEVYFKPFVDYNKIGCYSYDNLKDALIGAISGEHLEANESRYAFKFIKKMVSPQ